MTDGPSTYVHETFEVIDAIEHLTDRDTIIARLATCLSKFGFTGFLVTGLPFPRERLEPHILLNGWPDGWFARYMEANHYPNDPCVRHCFSMIDPFAWEELPQRLVEGQKPMQVMNEAREFGLAQGLCVPLHDVYGFQAVVTMAGEKIDLPPAARRMVHLLSLYAYSAAERVGRSTTYHDSVERLSSRECEVLRWAAIGKTAWDIGQILGISAFTVSDHLRNARRKLGTSNNVHTVVEALRRREITL